VPGANREPADYGWEAIYSSREREEPGGVGITRVLLTSSLSHLGACLSLDATTYYTAATAVMFISSSSR
jgi:hypothetical protein